jgi:hypothetical protein
VAKNINDSIIFKNGLLKPIGPFRFRLQKNSATFESIWNFGTERFNYFLDAIILKCPALVS